MNTQFQLFCVLLAVGLLLVAASTYVMFATPAASINENRIPIIIVPGGLGAFSATLSFFAFRQSQAVNDFVSGEDLIASWTWEKGFQGQRRSGSFHVGQRGFCKNGFAVIWSNQCKFISTFVEDEQQLVFRYRKFNRTSISSSGGSGWSSKVHTFPIPIPPEHGPDALRVVQIYSENSTVADGVE